MTDTHVVYTHHRADTHEVFYVGQGICKARANSKKGRSQFWHKIVNKYGYFSVIRATELNKNQADALESSFIKTYGRRNLNEGPLCNLTDGGEGTVNRIYSGETRKKISVSSSRPENIERLRANNANITEATRLKISAAKRGVKPSDSARAKMSAARKGVVVTEETRLLIGDALRGRVYPQMQGKNNPNYKSAKVYKGTSILDGSEVLLTGKQEILEAGFTPKYVYAFVNGKFPREHYNKYTWEVM